MEARSNGADREIPEVGAHFSIYEPSMANNRDEIYAELRDRCPVVHSDQTEADGFWVVTKYADTSKVLLDPATYSSRNMTLPRDLMDGPGITVRPPNTLDPPRHTEFRDVLMPFFTHKAMKKWVPTIRRVAASSIAEFSERGRCEAKAEFATKLALELMSEVYRVPPGRQADFGRWVHDMFEGGDPERALAASMELYAYLEEQGRDRDGNPQDDLISAVVHSEFGGSRLSGDELLGTLVTLLTAAIDTVASVMSGSLVHLATHPEDRRRLVEDPSLIPAAVEEFLRLYAAIVLARETTTDAELGDAEIAENSMVATCLASANRDAEVYSEPDEFILGRKEKRHVAFGLGPHQCLGRALARLELQTGLEVWLQAIPEFELDGEVPGYTLGLVNGPEAVPLKFEPRTISVDALAAGAQA